MPEELHGLRAEWLRLIGKFELEAVKPKYKHYNGVGKSRLYRTTLARTPRMPWDHSWCTNRFTIRRVDSNDKHT